MKRSALIFLSLSTLSSIAFSGDTKKQPSHPAVPAPAQTAISEGPSLSDTTAWILEKLSAYGGGSFQPPGPVPPAATKYEDIKIDGCSISFKSVVKIGTDATYTSSISASLTDLDSGSVRVTSGGPPSVEMKTEGLLEKVSVTAISLFRNSPPKETAKKGNSISFILNDPDISVRMVNAFRRAIDLCKNRKEAF